MLRQEILIPASIERVAVIERIGKVLKALPLARYKVIISENKAKRSDEQNRYLWGVVYPSILKAGGNTLAGWEADELHEYLLGEHFGWEILEGFGTRKRRPIRRSSKLSKLEFVDFTQFIQRKMAEHGIYVPDPNE